MPRYEIVILPSCSDTIDLCKDCYDDYANCHTYDGMDICERNVKHPPYEQSNYFCDKCDNPLDEEDN